MKRGLLLPLSLLILATMVISGCTASISNAAQSADSTESGSSTQLDFTLQTNIVDGQMVYVGVGGDIDGVVNPDLPVLEWEGYGLWGDDDATKCKAMQIDADNQMRIGYCGEPLTATPFNNQFMSFSRVDVFSYYICII